MPGLYSRAWRKRWFEFPIHAGTSRPESGAGLVEFGRFWTILFIPLASVKDLIK